MSLSPISLDAYRASKQPPRPQHLLTACELPEGGVGLEVGPVRVTLTDDQVEVVAAFLETYLARRGGGS